MKSYKELSYKEIDEMTLAELNEYINVYGKLLRQRLQRVERAKSSREKTAAINFITPTIKNVSLKVDLSGKPLPDSEIIEFKNKREARARLINLTESLRATRSTITGQKKISRKQRVETRKFIAAQLSPEVAKSLSTAELDLLGDVLNELGHGRAEYTSGEIIEAFEVARSLQTDKDQMTQIVKDILNGVNL